MKAGGQAEHAQPLAGVNVVVTRPADQAESLCREIEALGGRAIRYPVLAIRLLEKPDPELAGLLSRLAGFDLAIFISANAVKGAAQLIQAPLPPALQLAAVGKRTAETVKQQWPGPVLVPADNYNSEGLLAMPQLQQLKDRNIIIFRGRGGRELLAEELTRRGASVCYAEVYERTTPTPQPASLKHEAPIDLITVTSNEGLENLYRLTPDEDKPWLLDQALVVISDRGAERARELGFRQTPLIAAKADDGGLLAAVRAWKNQGATNRS